MSEHVKSKTMSWFIFGGIAIVLIAVYIVLSGSIGASNRAAKDSYEDLNTTNMQLQAEYDELSESIDNASSVNSVVSIAKKNGYISENEMVIYIDYPDQFDEQDIYVEEEFNPYDIP